LFFQLKEPISFVQKQADLVRYFVLPAERTIRVRFLQGYVQQSGYGRMGKEERRYGLPKKKNLFF
jgi:hypothetical protein